MAASNEESKCQIPNGDTPKHEPEAVAPMIH